MLNQHTRKALNELNKAEAAVVRQQEAYENSLKSLEELKEQQAVATLLLKATSTRRSF